MKRYHGPTADPIRDADRWLDDEMEWSQSRPVCCNCGEHITDEDIFQAFGHLYCEECFDSCAIPEFKSRCRNKTENFLGACWESA